MTQKSKRILQVCETFFLLTALILFGISIVLTVSTKRFIENAEMTTAIITKFGDRGNNSTSATLSYEVNKSLYETTIHEYSSSWNVGEPLIIYYDPSNPHRIKTKSMMYFIPIILGSVGLVFAIAMIVLEVIKRRAMNKKERLLSEGRKVYAVITDISINHLIRVNRKHPYKAKASYEDDYSGVIYHFESENFWEESIVTIGQEVPVYINPKNPKDYYMDLENK